MQMSVEYANQRNYLDNLFKVYPTIPNDIRSIDEERWAIIEDAFKRHDNEIMIKYLLHLDLFPIKDSYVAFLKRDSGAIERNPKTVARLCGALYEMGLDKIYEKCSSPKETNRQIGPMFRNWVNSKVLGIAPVPLDEFTKDEEDAILCGSDRELMSFAKERLGYTRNKGLDFVGRFGGKYVIGEDKFLSDFGGHQDAQLEDALLTLQDEGAKAVKIAVLDGVVWLKTQNKMHTTVVRSHASENIFSALLLRDFLYSL